MKRLNYLTIWILLITIPASANKAGNYKAEWTVNHPGQMDVFVKNYGQYDYMLNAFEPVPEHAKEQARYVVNSKTQVLFTPHGYIWRIPSRNTDPERTEESRPEIKFSFIRMIWEGANPQAQLLAEGEANGFYAYADEAYRNLKAKGYKKLIYKDLYPGIDVEYIIPENKEGIKYSLILKPGADIKKVKMHYEGDLDKLDMDTDGNIVIETAAGNIIDHAPQSFYFDNKKPLKSNFKLGDNNTIEFSLPQGYNTKALLVIDPWTIVPTLAGGTGPYDVAYDKFGEVYIDFIDGPAGFSYSPKISKYTPAGVFLWTIDMAGDGFYNYSKFCVIPSGSVFIAASDMTDHLAKISAAGTLVATTTWAATLNDEGWVVEYNECLNTLLIGGGGVYAAANALCLRMGADTSLAGAISANAFNGATAWSNDIGCMKLDNNGDLYTYFSSGPAAGTNNTLYKSLAPYSTFTFSQLRATCAFSEASSIPRPFGYSNRYNVMAVNGSYLYFFDGQNLEARSKVTGALITSTVVSAGYVCGSTLTSGPPQYKSEGIAADECNNIYVGGQSLVHVFNFNGSTFTALPTIAVPGNVYDIILDRSKQLIYVTGNGFLSSQTALPCSTNSLLLTPLSSGSCSGSGTASVNVSGGTAPYTYLWSNGVTANTINAPSGNYVLTVTDGSCSTPLSDTITVTIGSGSGPAVTAASSVNLTCTVTSSVLTGTSAGNAMVWNGGALVNAANPATVTAAGSYTVTATNSANGCTATQAVAVTSNTTPPVVTAASSTNLTCTVTSSTLTGTSAGNAMVWNGGSLATNSPNPASVNAPGTYTVTATDATSGCTSTASVTVSKSGGPSASTLNTGNISCNGASTGSASVTALGGVGTYTYSWSPFGGTGSTAINLNAGNYSVTVSDGNGCTAVSSVSITEPSALTANASSTIPLCSGSGSVSVNPGGGSPGYNYFWSPGGAAGQTATNLANGSYTVTVTDSKGCTTSSTTTLSIPLPITVTTSSIAAACGSANGSASASATGGTGSMGYTWSNAASGQTTTAIAAGTYTVTATDANNCTSSTVAIVSNNSGPGISSVNPVNILCNGSSTGSASVIATGGTGTLTYNWASTGGSGAATGGSGATASGLSAGTYQVSVTDNLGCKAVSSVIITQPPDLKINPTVVSATCGTANGSINVNVIGGSGGYTYSWSAGVIGSGAAVSGLAAGNYTVTVSDANNCSQTARVVLKGSPAVIISSLTDTKVKCNGGTDGTATVIATGGSEILTYSWSQAGGISGSTTGASGLADIEAGLSAGLVAVTVTDSLGCIAASEVNITQPAALGTPNVSQTSTSCGKSNGSADVFLTGGTPGYAYTWSSNAGAVGSTSQATAIGAGSYTVTISDANGCTTSTALTISNTGGPTISSIVPTDPLCSNQTGSAQVNANGTGTLTYSWAPSGGNALQASGLSAGTYTVTVTDQNGCNTTQTVSISAPSPVTATTQGNAASCGLSNGSAQASATGGTGISYTYAWSNLINTESNGNIKAGTYTVTVTDQNSCTASSSVMIRNNPPPGLKITDSTNTCAGKTDGSITVTTTGTGILSYNWSASGGSGTLSSGLPIIKTGLSAGSYTVTVTDQNGCTATTSVTILQLPSPTVTVGSDTVILPGGSAQLYASGGISYLWTPAGTLSNPNIYNPIADPDQTTTYTVIVKNANDCAASDSVKVIVKEINCDSNAIFMPTAFSPNGDGQNDVLYLRGTQTCVVQLDLKIYDRWGEKVFETNSMANGWDGSFRGIVMNTGVFVYYLNITLTNGQSVIRKGNITLLR